MKLYIDTSVWVAVFAAERETARATQWLETNIGNEIIVSPWVGVELSSALSAKIRSRQIDEAKRDEAYERYLAAASSVRNLPIQSDDFQIAARWCARHETGLRAGDALHLAVAGRNGATLCTLNRKLSQAGERLAVKTLLV